MASSGFLYNPQHERFAQLVVAGKSPEDAAIELGKAPGTGPQWMKRPYILSRIRVLQRNAAKRAELSRQDIIENVVRQMELAEKLGQCSAALKASEMLGKELHHMFVDRKEIGAPGDFDNKNEDELRAYIVEQLEKLGLKLEDVKLLTAQPQTLDLVPASTDDTVN